MGMSDNKEIGEKYGIHPRDVEKVKFAFDVYDFKGDGKVDGFYIGDLLRACNLNPTLATIDEVGGMKEKGKKIMVIDDFYQILAKVKLAKGTGGIQDFVEILKLYDKNEDGTILGNELFGLLTNLGEKLTKEEAKGLMKELCEPEDDEGFMPFMPFLERCAPTNKLSWKGCALTKVKLAQAQKYIQERVIAHFWTEFAINENLILLLCTVRPIKCV